MTRRERLERKLEKRQEWAEKRRSDATARFKAAQQATEGIPMGQPILIGHHSEKRHRAAIARSDANMRKSCESSDMAAHHESKAAGLARQLDGSIFSDDPDALEQLAARIEELEAERNRNNAINKIVRAKPRAESTPEKLAQLAKLGLSETVARKLFEPDCFGGKGIPSYVNKNLGGNIKRLRDRVADIKRRQARSEAAEKNGGIVIEGDEWVRVTFAEKPSRDVLNALKSAGFRWGGGSWTGKREHLPECVTV